MKLVDHFQRLRKAQLQEYFVRWFPHEEMTSDKDKLVEQLHVAMCDPKTIRRRFDRLSKSSQDFLVALLTRPQYRGTVEQIRESPRGRSIEAYEVENLVKNLTSEGWVIPVSEASNGTRLEVYVLPDEIGEGLGVTIDVEFRDPATMLTLAAAIGSRDSVACIEELTEADRIEQRIESLSDGQLRETVRMALDGHGGVLRLSQWHLYEEGSGHLHREDWRGALEEAFLGTTGVISLKSYGLDVEEECLVVYQELVTAYHERAIEQEEIQNEVEYCLGADLLIDIRRLLDIARSEALEVTREGTVFKKTEERLESQLLLNQARDLFEGSPLPHVIGLCKKLRILDQGDHFLRPDPLRRRIWLKKRLDSKVRAIFELYQNEFRGNRWSFHQRMIREIFLDEVCRHDPGRWIPTRSLLAISVARFVGTLEKEDVAKVFRDLQLEEFHNETLMVPLDRLQQDLSYWIVHRLAVAGLVNLGFRGGRFHSIQLSTIGARIFKIDASDGEKGRVVVNPDFEILLFPGASYDEKNYTLAAFADRTASELVKRYRLSPDSVKRGVISGMTADEIIGFLEKESEIELPPNISFSIREWAEGIEPVLKQRVLLLKTKSSKGADHVTQILEEHEISHERVGELAVVVRGAKNERRIRELQDVFQIAGLVLE